MDLADADASWLCTQLEIRSLNQIFGPIISTNSIGTRYEFKQRPICLPYKSEIILNSMLIRNIKVEERIQVTERQSLVFDSDDS